MKTLHTALVAAGLAIASIGSASAALVAGTGGGYYGSAWYNSNQGSVVGPYSTYYACNQALQAAIDNATNNFGWSVTSVSPCSYTPPFAPMQVEYELAVVDDGSGDTGTIAGTLWAAVNAVTQYADWERPARGEGAEREQRRLRSMWLGPGAALKAKAWNAAERLIA